MRVGLLLSLLSAAVLGTDSDASRVAQYYQIERVPTPSGIEPQVGGLTALPDGRIAACFHQGQVAIFNPQDQTWQTFAEGLHEPLGILAETEGSLLVMQRPELTRLRDTDRDGVADSYESVWAGFGLTGNYHEFAFGPARGANGKLYLALNLASNGAGIREEIRGKWSPIGLPREQFYNDWSTVSAKAGRMFSRVPWRGWVMEVDPVTGSATPFASGFRSPDGIGFDLGGNLLVTDNQGDWRGANELHVIKRGGFYGHPASLVWREDWAGANAVELPREQLDALRTPAAVWMAETLYANSPTQMVVIPKTAAWGPFGGQTLVGEMNAPQLMRMLIEEIDGVWQGACVNLVKTPALKNGLHRLAFAGDTLWIGRTHLAWPGGEGMATLKPTGKTPFDPLDIHITPRGFRFEFTQALAPTAVEPARWKVERYTFRYHAAYGSPQVEKGVVEPVRVMLTANGKVAEVELPKLRPDFVYDFDLNQLRSVTDEAPLNPKLAYTVRRVPQSRAAASANLKPDAVLRFEFPDLPPNTAEMFRKDVEVPVPNVHVAELPANYSAERQFPIVVYLDGGNGGNYLPTKGLREALGPDDFIAVRLPLFKAAKIPSDPVDGRMILSKNFDVIRTSYRTMLEKLFATVPHITPQGSTLGGFSNGAHTTAVLLEGRDEFTLKHFDRFYFVEGGVHKLGGETLKFPALKPARMLVVLGDRGRGNPFARFGNFIGAEGSSGVEMTTVSMRGYGHEWPLGYKKLLPLWLRAHPLPEIAPKPADVPGKPAEAVEPDRPAERSNP